MATSPNMNIDLPIVQVTIGPQWASDLNEAIGTTIDAHDHSPGKGVPITPAGIAINSDLSFNNNRAIAVAQTIFQEQDAAPTGNPNAGSVYVVNGDLYYTNGAGVPVQITVGPVVNAAGSAGNWTTATISAFPYTVLTSDNNKVLLINTTAPRTINLPPATDLICFKVKDISGLAGINPITIVPNGSDTIDGLAAAFALRVNRGAWEFISDGTSNWYFT